MIKLKTEKEFHKAFDKYWNFKWDWKEFLECGIVVIGCMAISMLLSFGNMIIMGILFLVLLFSFIEGKPFNLKRFLPSYKKRQKEKEEFERVLWGYVLNNLSKNKREEAEKYIIEKGYCKC